MMAIEEFQGIMSKPYTKFPFILFGYEFMINGIRIYIYWGDNLALIISYFLLRNKKLGIKYKELLYGISFLFLYDVLVLCIDPFSRRLSGGIAELFIYVSGIITVVCGIVSLVLAYKYLKQNKAD